MGDQTLSAVIQAARLGDSEAIQFAQKYGINYSKEPSSFGISGGTSNVNRPPSGRSNRGGGGSTNSGSSVTKPTGDTTTEPPSAPRPSGGFLPSVSRDNKTGWDDFAKGKGPATAPGLPTRGTTTKPTRGTTTKPTRGGTTPKMRRYSNGIENGPVTYTGLAMLHGTPSAPEYVLNSDQAYSLLRYMATNSPKFTPINSSGNVTYSYGDIIMNGVNDPEKFFSELTSAMDRKYSTTKNRK